MSYHTTLNGTIRKNYPCRSKERGTSATRTTGPSPLQSGVTTAILGCVVLRTKHLPKGKFPSYDTLLFRSTVSQWTFLKNDDTLSS